MAEDDEAGDGAFDELLRAVAAAPDVPMALGDTGTMQGPGHTVVPARQGHLQPGEQVDDYQVKRLLGRGGMGEVYLARDVRLGRPVALKLVRGALDAEAAARFLREAQLTARFNHPNIVTVYGVGQHAAGPYIALEYLEGQTLRGRLDAGAIPLAEAAEIGRGMAAALDEAHRHGILHRDLKPANVFLGDGRVRVLDFGLARPTGPSASEVTSDTATQDLFETRDHCIRGTPAYMAPEQWSGAACGPTTDVWALGVVLFEMLGGLHPWGRLSTQELAARVTSGARPPRLRAANAEVPPRLAELVERCLSPAPEARPSAAEVVAALADEPDQRTESTPPVPPGPGWKRALWYAIGLPLAWSLWPLTYAHPGIAFSALGLPEGLPVVLALLLATLVCAGQTWVVIRLERGWRGAGRDRWLHGPTALVVPSIGLALTLWHLLTLNGQQQAHRLTLWGYGGVTARQARDMATLLSESYTRFMHAVTADLLVVAVLALLVLLGELFRAGRPGWFRRHVLVVLGLGLLLVVAAEAFLVREALAFMGVWRFVLYLVWLLTAVAWAKADDGDARGGLRAGACACLAAAGLQLVMGFAFVFQFVTDAPGPERWWRYDDLVRPAMQRGALAEAVLLAAMFGVLVWQARRRRGSLARSEGPSLRWSTALLGVTGAPALLVLTAMGSVDDIWLGDKLSTMTPASLESGAPPSFYLDRAPRSLRPGRKVLHAALTTERWVEDGSLLEVLAGRGTCPDLIRESVVEGGVARCVSAVEARLYCEGLGLRLPTPEEWDAAMAHGEQTRPAHSEWTMRTVHGSPSFELRGGAAGATPPAAQAVPDAGFRCAFSFRP